MFEAYMKKTVPRDGRYASRASKRDAEIRRPMPLQIQASGESGFYRLYSGRNFVTFRVAATN